MLATLDARLAQARAGELGHLDFLQVLCEDEISRRDVHVPAPPDPPRPVRRPGHPRRVRLRRLARSCPPPRSATWPPCAGSHAGESVILYGPVGVGKSHVAQALGHLAIRARRQRPVPQDQPGAGPPGRRPRRPHLGQTARRAHPARRPHPRRLRHARAHRRPRPTTSTSSSPNAAGTVPHPHLATGHPADWYPLFPNPVVAESLLDRLINTSHQVFMNGPSFRPNKAPGRVVPPAKTSGS